MHRAPVTTASSSAQIAEALVLPDSRPHRRIAEMRSGFRYLHAPKCFSPSWRDHKRPADSTRLIRTRQPYDVGITFV